MKKEGCHTCQTCHNYMSDIQHKITSPYIPDQIYDVLPPTLKEACNVFKGRERDVFFTSALSVISGGLHNVSGLYANDKVVS